LEANMRQRRNPSHSSRFAQLFSIGMGHFAGWDDMELSRMLQQQLHSPMLGTLKPRGSEIFDLLMEAHSPGSRLPETMGELLTQPDPPLELLRLAKDFAKSPDAAENPLPAAIAQAIYISAIAAALARHGERISATDDWKLRASFQWVEDQPWIDKSLRSLATTAIAKLDELD
jgi:hypothetical protein